MWRSASGSAQDATHFWQSQELKELEIILQRLASSTIR
jgi:hypothetical protein